MKQIVYLNLASAIPPKRENGKWTIDELVIDNPPAKCKVIINDKFVIDDVYIHMDSEDKTIRLYNNYKIQKTGCCWNDKENSWAIFVGNSMVLQFKSDNYVIMAM